MTVTFKLPSIAGGLACLNMWGFRPKLAVDVGAYHGEWTRLFKMIFPECAVIMVEAQEARQPLLHEVCGSFPDVTCEMALLAREEGARVRFVEMELGGSSAFEEASHFPRTVVEKTSRTLDGVLGDKASAVDFLKLDVQGYELEVLAGGGQSLRSAKAVLLEASLLPTNAGCPLIAEVMKYMDAYGFRLLDICTLLRRKDGALWQVDLLFVHVDSGLLPEPRLTEATW